MQVVIGQLLGADIGAAASATLGGISAAALVISKTSVLTFIGTVALAWIK